jgi:Flp pilus assembly protein TadB
LGKQDQEAAQPMARQVEEEPRSCKRRAQTNRCGKEARRTMNILLWILISPVAIVLALVAVMIWLICLSIIFKCLGFVYKLITGAE